ncbi:hypothetical protein GLAREA_05356 [Glarea lozoyensis ATCC 20868]|uniref:Uncharacterized protein n=1 Tax=Glarea lozoyensis (strain ATCC 20868 / MF5171) TaxID=1116229 RepID=S3ECI4_GLAL2|nr:uncharacterized protein GLAREA_05356 [Glarea lozoyensis ATCC 20868]EPE36018.1 hypothetical protein GLAREA_05356 [Glarea lozoyensis ATCC 20868]
MGGDKIGSDLVIVPECSPSSYCQPIATEVSNLDRSSPQTMSQSNDNSQSQLDLQASNSHSRQILSVSPAINDQQPPLSNDTKGDNQDLSATIIEGPAQQTEYEIQLKLLEQQNKKRLLMARNEQDTHAATLERQPCLPLFQRELLLLETQCKRRINLHRQEQYRKSCSQKRTIAEAEQNAHIGNCGTGLHRQASNAEFANVDAKLEDEKNASTPSSYIDQPCSAHGLVQSPTHDTLRDSRPSSAYVLADYQLQLAMPEHHKRLQPRSISNEALEEYRAKISMVDEERKISALHSIGPMGNHALQDYQMQLELLEKQNEKRKVETTAASDFGVSSRWNEDNLSMDTQVNHPPPNSQTPSLQDYSIQLMLLEQ